jgi:hypothetical protein
MSMWSRLFGKDPKELFLLFAPHETSWRVVSWNFDLRSPSQRHWIIEVHGEELSSIEWDKDKLEEVRFFRASRLLRKRRISPNEQELKVLMNLAIHSTVKYSLEENKEFMVTPVSGATTEDFQNEFRYLQWIQASFGTLHRALDQIASDRDLVLTAAFFGGIEKESGDRVVRLIAMNLDIFFSIKPDQSLQIVIFDDKARGHGMAKQPSFYQIIKVTKPQFYDEMVKLVHRLAIVGELK